jgi:hypothetical protein
MERNAKMRVRELVLAAFAVVAMIPSAGALQVRSPASGTPTDAVDVSLALQIEGQPYKFDGKALCRHAPVASIYDVPAQMWSIQQNDGRRSFSLTVWRPKGKTETWFALAVSTGGKSYLVNTVEAGRGTVQGQGKLTFAPLGPGGTFTIDATAAKGGAISGTIKCSAFTALVAEGGD